MSTDITSTNSTTGHQGTLLRQLPSVKKQSSEVNSNVKADNIIRINFEPRQEIAKTDNTSDPKSLTNDKTVQTPANVDKSIVELNNSDQVVSRNLEFHIDKDSGRTVITVRDSQSKEVIRQIPSEKLLEISEKLKSLQTSSDGNSVNTGILFTSQT